MLAHTSNYIAHSIAPTHFSYLCLYPSHRSQSSGIVARPTRKLAAARSNRCERYIVMCSVISDGSVVIANVSVPLPVMLLVTNDYYPQIPFRILLLFYVHNLLKPVLLFYIHCSSASNRTRRPRTPNSTSEELRTLLPVYFV